eukprot:975199-Rhodomonas_salina.1
MWDSQHQRKRRARERQEEREPFLQDPATLQPAAAAMPAAPQAPWQANPAQPGGWPYPAFGCGGWMYPPPQPPQQTQQQ